MTRILDVSKILLQAIKNSEVSYEKTEEALLAPSLPFSDFICLVLGIPQNCPIDDVRYCTEFSREFEIQLWAQQFLQPADLNEWSKKHFIHLVRQEWNGSHNTYWIYPIPSLMWVLDQYNLGKLTPNPWIFEFIEKHFKPEPAKKPGSKPKHQNSIAILVDLSQQSDHFGMTTASKLWNTPIGENVWKGICKAEKENKNGAHSLKQQEELKKKLTKKIRNHPEFSGKKNQKKS